MEQSIKQCQDELAYLRQVGGLATWYWDLQTDRATWSQELYDIYGLDLDSFNVTPESYLERVHPEDIEKCRTEMQKAREGSSPFVMEYRLVLPDGSLKLLHACGKLIFNDSGLPAMLMGVVRDVTEQRRSEASPKSSDQWFRDIGENIREILWVKDPHSQRILYVNRAYESILGTADRSFAEIQKSALTRVHPDDMEKMKTVIDAHYRSEPLDVEFRILKPEQGTRWLHLKTFPVNDSAGELNYVVGVADDITEKKWFESALKESEERIRLALDASDQGMWFWDLRKYELTWTDKCKALFGLPPQTKMTFEEFLSTFHPEDRHRAEQAVRHTLATGSEYRIEGRTIWPDGTVHWVLTKGRGLFDAMGRATAMMGIAVDITARKQEEAEKEKLIADLQAALAHIKILSGILPICSHCKKIRNDEGYWQQLEEYLRFHTEAEFSHGICPECARQHYPDVFKTEL